jgi:hypothetical protein
LLCVNLYVLWKETLTSDGQQFHQYQQNEQSPLISNCWAQKRPEYMLLEIYVLLGQVQKYGGVKPINGIPTPSPLDNWISNNNTDIICKYLKYDKHHLALLSIRVNSF